jgi:excisionase family DNA binding protein
MRNVNSEIEEAVWFSIPEAAEYLGISEPTIYRWMREGKLSFYKVGDSTRFKKENLDMVFEKHTGTHEADYHSSRCAACGNTGLVPGRVQSTGKVYFKPRRTRFLTLHDSLVGVEAWACPRCGFVQLFTDTQKLDILLRQEDRPRPSEPEL